MGCSPSCGAICATLLSRRRRLTTTLSADLTGQANHLGVTIEADIIKQKQPENNGGYIALKFGRTDPLVYDQLTTDHPIDLTRWQVVNCYSGRIGLINSGGESQGRGDFAQAVRTAVINKRAGGMGLIVGRKAFQRPMSEGVGTHPSNPGRLPRRLGHSRLARQMRAVLPVSPVVPQAATASPSGKAPVGRMPITTGKQVTVLVATVARCRPASRVEEP